MVTVTREFAEQLADVARLLDRDEAIDQALGRLTGMGVQLVPGGTAAAMTIAMPKGALTFAASDPRLDDLHRLQFDADTGPVVETLRHNEPRRVDDTGRTALARILSGGDRRRVPQLPGAAAAHRASAGYRAARRMIDNLQAAWSPGPSSSRPRASCTPSSASPRPKPSRC